jgi:HEAT repeat protein
MSEQARRALTVDEERQVRFWVDALVKGPDPARAAHELHSIGVRTRGAIRTRGSAVAPARSRFPTGTDVTQILATLQTRTSPHLRIGVAAALAEWGGSEALGVLRRIAVGEHRDPDPAVRAAVLDAVSIIGGPEALHVLADASASEDDADLKRTADALIQSANAHQS